MLPYIDPESIYALLSLTGDEPAIDISEGASQGPAAYRGPDHIAPHGAPSRIVAAVMTALMICLIIYLIAV